MLSTEDIFPTFPMKTKTSRVRRRALTVATIAITLFLAGQALFSAPLHAAPKVEWSLEQVDLKIAVTDRKPVRIRLTAKQDLPATQLQVTPSLEDWVVAVRPPELPPMLAGEEAVIDLVLTGDHVGVVDGTLKVREMSPPRALARPLPIVLDGVSTIEETLPPEPDPEENAATLLGVDEDQDGVRDDIQRSIALEHSSEPAVRQALYQLANSQSMVYEATAGENVKRRLDQARRCVVWSTEDEFRAVGLNRELHKAYFDTLDRARAYLQFNASLDVVATFGLSASEACDFNLEAMQ